MTPPPGCPAARFAGRAACAHGHDVGERRVHADLRAQRMRTRIRAQRARTHEARRPIGRGGQATVALLPAHRRARRSGSALTRCNEPNVAHRLTRRETLMSAPEVPAEHEVQWWTSERTADGWSVTRTARRGARLWTDKGACTATGSRMARTACGRARRPHICTRSAASGGHRHRTRHHGA